MSIPIIETCKKRRRRPKIYKFQSFCEHPGSPMYPVGTFRENIRIFLQECAEPEDYNVDGMPIWCTLLVLESNNFVLPLYTIEETSNYSPNPFCDHCRCTGWGNHFVTKRRYHVIVPIDGEWTKRLEEGVLDLNTHILHGLIHCNGFGHLLCINGIEGGSRRISGREIMNLWDRICEILQARKISVEDVSKKRSMDLRLLYGVAYGHSWFGRWGYKFFHGSFGISEHNYNCAIEILSSLGLDRIIDDFSDTGEYGELRRMIDYYRTLSEIRLTTFRDLLRFILTIKSCPCAQKKLRLAASAPALSASLNSKFSICASETQKKLPGKEKTPRYRKFSTLICSHNSRWPARRLEYTAGVIVDALKAKKKADKGGLGGMTRQDVRDVARLQIGDTGLLDYVLKSMNNVIIGGYAVRRAVNPKTKILEYSIDELGNRNVRFTEQEIVVSEPVPAPPVVPGDDIYADLAFLYTKVLRNYPESELVASATQVILDSKHLVKDWPFKDADDQLLRFICRVKPDIIHFASEMMNELPPGEIIILPLHATIAELKQAAENTLRDTYCILDKFEVTEIDHKEELMDEELLFGSIESGSELYFRGNNIDLNTELRYESGPETWKVRCECGARDDDGERMVACDICEVWQHTRCNGIEASENVPPLFICTECCHSVMQSRKKVKVEIGNSDDLLMMVPESFTANNSFGMLL